MGYTLFFTPHLTQPTDFAERDFVALNVQATALGTQYQFWAWVETSGVHYFAITVAADGTLTTESSFSR